MIGLIKEPLVAPIEYCQIEMTPACRDEQAYAALPYC